MPPLTGKRILITRFRHQASELAALLAGQGAECILIPTIEIAPPLDFGALDEALARLGGFDWLVFTSANAVHAFAERAAVHGIHPLPRILTAVIGPATARAAAAIGLKVDVVPEKAVAESLASAVLPLLSPGARVLLPRAAEARDHLPEVLTAAGVQVTVAEAYRTLIPADSLSALQRLFADASRYPDAITFTSSSTATNLLALLETGHFTLPPGIVRASIGPITTGTLTEHGFPPHIKSPEATIPALVGALVEALTRQRSS